MLPLLLGTSHHPSQQSYTLDIRKKLFTMVLAKHRNRLPRGAVDVLSLEAPTTRLDGALSNLDT